MPTNFVARDSKDPDLIYATAPAELNARVYISDEKKRETHEGSVVVLRLDGVLPPLFELIMPDIIINGVRHDIPALLFEHHRGPGVVPMLINY